MSGQNTLTAMMAPDNMAGMPGSSPMDALVDWYHSQQGPQPNAPMGPEPMGSPMDQSLAGQENQLSAQALMILKNYTG